VSIFYEIDLYLQIFLDIDCDVEKIYKIHI